MSKTTKGPRRGKKGRFDLRNRNEFRRREREKERERIESARNDGDSLGNEKVKGIEG